MDYHAEDGVIIQSHDTAILTARVRLVEGGPTPAEISDAELRGETINQAIYLARSSELIEGLEGVFTDWLGLVVVGFLLLGAVIALSAVKREFPCVF